MPRRKPSCDASHLKGRRSSSPTQFSLQQSAHASLVLKNKSNGQCARAPTQRGALRQGDETHEVLLGRHREQAVSVAAGQQPLGVSPPITIMIVKALCRGEMQAGIGKGVEEFFRLPDSGKSQQARTRKRAYRGGIGVQRGVQNSQATLLRRIEQRGSRPRILSDNQNRVAARKLRRQRRAQRAGWKCPSIANSTAPIDNGDCKIFLQGGILQSVVHDDDARATLARYLGAMDAIARHDRGRRAGEEKRFVAHVFCAMHIRIHLDWAGIFSAITAAEKERPFPHLGEQARGGNRRRCFARAAKGEISDANNWNARGLP